MTDKLDPIIRIVLDGQTKMEKGITTLTESVVEMSKSMARQEERHQNYMEDRARADKRFDKIDTRITNTNQKIDDNYKNSTNRINEIKETTTKNSWIISTVKSLFFGLSGVLGTLAALYSAGIIVI